MIRSFFRSIRGRLLLPVLVGLLPLAGFYAYQMREMRASLERSWSTYLDETLGVVRDRQEEVLGDLHRSARLLAAVPTADAGPRYLCRTVLPQISVAHAFRTEVHFLTPAGELICGTPTPDSGGIVPSLLPAAPRSPPDATSTFRRSADGHRPLAVIAVPRLAGDSSVTMIVAAAVDLSEIPPLPAGSSLRPDVTLTLFDYGGNVIRRTPPLASLASRRVADELLRTARDQAGDTTLEDLDGTVRRFGTTPIRAPDGRIAGYLAAGYAPAYLSAEIARIARSSAAGFALTTLLLILGIGLALEVGVIRRLRSIVGAAQRVAEGEPSTRLEYGGGQDEVSVLARAVDNMAESLERRRRRETAQARLEMAETEERFRQLAAAIDEAFWIWDPEAERTVYLSPAFERIWSRPREEVLDEGGRWLSTVHPDDLEKAATPWSDSGEPQEREYRIILPDGTTRWILDRAFPVMDEDGKIIRYVGVAGDVTERKVLQETVRQSTKLEAVGRLAGGVAHDFNNVLTAIQGHTQLLLDDLPPDSPIRDDLREIDRSAERAASLTRQLLAFSRKQQIQPRVVALNEVVSELRNMLVRLIGEDVQLEIRLSEDAWPVRADVNQMEQVLVNLCVNARDAMPGGGTVTISTENRVVTANPGRSATHGVIPPGEWVRLSVKDTGEGMDDAVITRIFEPFYTTKEQGKGTGLGLASVYGIVKQSGGFIWVESEAGEGAEFALYLPRADRTGEEPAAAGDQAPADEAGRATGRILLVEDEDPVRSITRRTLERLGYEVVEAADGHAALARLNGEGDDFDLLLTDVVMPGMSGPQLLRKLRERRPNVPVIFMSGYLGHQDLDAALRNPETPVLQKPFTADQLGRAVRTAFAAASA